MRPDRRIVLLVLLGAVVGWGVWSLVALLGSGRGGSGREAGARGAASDAGSAAAALDDRPLPEAVATRDLEMETGAPAADAQPGESDAEIERELILHGRVVDASAEPIVGATVEVFLPSAREFSVLDLDYHREIVKLTETRSDLEGRFEIRLERGRAVDLKVAADGTASRWVPDRYAGERVEVVLDQGCTLRGRITRAVDGAPVAGAALRVFRLGGPNTVSFRGATDAAGEYRLDGLPRDRMVLEVVPERERCPGWIELEFGADRTLVKDVAVESGIVVRGRVTDATDGHPLEGAVVGEGWTFRRSVRTDAAGEFELPGFGSEGVHDVHVRAEGYGRQLREKLAPAVEGVIEADFALAPARRATGRVIDSARTPIAGAYVAAVASEFTDDGQLAEWPSTRTGADGRFELGNLHPMLRHVLFVRARGLATVVYDFPPEEVAATRLELGEVVVPPAATLLGRVVDDRGDGVADVEVTLIGHNADRFRWLEEPGRAVKVAGSYVDSRTGRTDDRGCFQFTDLPAGSFHVKARARGRPSSADVAVDLAEGELRRGVDVLMPAGERIGGRIVAISGAGIPGVRIFASAIEGGRSSASARSGEDGAFEIAGLLPGRYRLQVQYFGMGGSDDRELLLPVDVESVEAGRRDLRIEMRPGASIEGVVLDADGALVAGAWVIAAIPAGEEANQGSWSATTDREGRFTVVVPRGAAVDLAVQRGRSGRQVRNGTVIAAGIAAGSKSVILRLPPADADDE